MLKFLKEYIKKALDIPEYIPDYTNARLWVYKDDVEEMVGESVKQVLNDTDVDRYRIKGLIAKAAHHEAEKHLATILQREAVIDDVVERINNKQLPRN